MMNHNANPKLFLGAVLAPTVGQWINLSDYGSEEEFLDAVAKVTRENEEKGYAESEIVCVEDFYGAEDWEIDDAEMAWKLYYEVALELDSDEEMEIFVLLAEDCGIDWMMRQSAPVDIFRDRYIGQYDSRKDYGRAFVEEAFAETAGANLPDATKNLILGNIDYEQLVRELEMDGEVIIRVPGSERIYLFAQG